jgi:hypothetical protein
MCCTVFELSVEVYCGVLSSDVMLMKHNRIALLWGNVVYCLVLQCKVNFMKKMIKRCPCCRGKKEIIGGGFMSQKCNNCAGSGYIETEIEPVKDISKELTKDEDVRPTIIIKDVATFDKPVRMKRKYNKRIK